MAGEVRSKKLINFVFGLFYFLSFVLRHTRVICIKLANCSLMT